MKDGNVHSVKLQYVPGQLRLSLDGAVTPNLTVPVNLSSLLSLNQGRASGWLYCQCWSDA